jgi:hypothetical protein
VPNYDSITYTLFIEFKKRKDNPSPFRSGAAGLGILGLWGVRGVGVLMVWGFGVVWFRGFGLLLLQGYQKYQQRKKCY